MADINNPQSPVNGGTAAVSSAASPQQATVPGGSPSGAQQQPRPCPQDCSKCGLQQHAFCAARMSFLMFEVMNGVINRLDRLDRQSQHISDLEKRLSAIQNSEAELSSPVPLQGSPFAGENQ